VVRAKTDLVVIHCSATKADQDIGRDEIDEWHRARGWDGIGYHYVIRRNGTIQVGRNFNEVGAHVKGHNRTSLGICWVGGLDKNGEPEDNRTEEQRRAIKALVGMSSWMWPGARICGHRDLSPDIDGDGIVEEWEWLKACPCFDVASEVESYESD
jgi:N-acetyl-anhydromuramyl-L-alanine amidase AmpD